MKSGSDMTEKEHLTPVLCGCSGRRASSLCATVVAGRREPRCTQNVVFVNIDATQADPARRGLHNQVIPRVSQTPGFVAGYWLEPLDGKGISVTLWESEQAARKAAGRIQPPSSPTTGVKVDRIETREVIGQA